MNKILRMLLPLLFCITAASATTIKGRVYDKNTGEPLVGATVTIEKFGKSTSTGLDGSFELKGLKAGAASLRVTYITYKTAVQEITVLEEHTPAVTVYMEKDTRELEEIAITSSGNGNTDNAARRIEQNAMQVMNIVSAKSIEISPDLTVANVMQRVSGVSIERNSNGDGQYAILRGMDKRYNYTLVNGVKIPSPDNKYRYVPLDLFPADLMDRLEVYKTLTPNLEGDAIGGAVNMVMKDAPNRFQVNANIASGYNQLFFDRKFTSYDASAVNHLSPYEVSGRTYNATQADFQKATLDYNTKKPAPNLIGSLSLGQRFLNDKLGVIVAASYQNTYRGSNSTLYGTAVSGTDAYATVTDKEYREYSDQQKRLGLHGKVDYVFNSKNKISLYNVYVNLQNIQIRDAVKTPFNGVYDAANGNSELVYTTRSRLTEQQIYNSTLHGDHKLFNDKFKIQWSALYSSAQNDVPDYTTISLNGVQKNFQQTRTVLVNTAPVTHRWERNTDEDKAGYLDLTYIATIGGEKVDISAGGLYRDKKRSNLLNNYTLAPSSANAGLMYGSPGFQKYSDLQLSVTNPTGGVANTSTYDAFEKTTAGYGMLKFNVKKLQVIGGVRVEHTDQGYNLLFPQGEPRPMGSQVYTDVLPSLTLKYHLTNKAQLHASYYKALNRPGFYEIVPSRLPGEDYVEKGNADLTCFSRQL
ncbi:TonB-dependent receptor domain-containing protein [Mucilaginibacter sp. HD30]